MTVCDLQAHGMACMQSPVNCRRCLTEVALNYSRQRPLISIASKPSQAQSFSWPQSRARKASTSCCASFTTSTPTLSSRTRSMSWRCPSAASSLTFILARSFVESGHPTVESFEVLWAFAEGLVPSFYCRPTSLCAGYPPSCEVYI